MMDPVHIQTKRGRYTRKLLPFFLSFPFLSFFVSFSGRGVRRMAQPGQTQAYVSAPLFFLLSFCAAFAVANFYGVFC